MHPEPHARHDSETARCKQQKRHQGTRTCHQQLRGLAAARQGRLERTLRGTSTAARAAAAGDLAGLGLAQVARAGPHSPSSALPGSGLGSAEAGPSGTHQLSQVAARQAPSPRPGGGLALGAGPRTLRSCSRSLITLFFPSPRLCQRDSCSSAHSSPFTRPPAMPFRLRLFALLCLAAGLTASAAPWDGAAPAPTAPQGHDPNGWSPAPTTAPSLAVVELLLKRQTSEPDYVCGYADGDPGMCKACSCPFGRRRRLLLT